MANEHYPKKNPPPDDLDILKYYAKKLWNWMWEDCARIAPLVQAITAVIMLWVLWQNSRTISANNQALEVQKVALTNTLNQLVLEQETRLNPELICSYNYLSNKFIFRNVGDVPAQVWFLQTLVYDVQSNKVLQLQPYARFVAEATPPLNKFVLNPNDSTEAKDGYAPDMDWVGQLWRQYGGDILITLYVEFCRTNLTYRNYSGYFYFTVTPLSLRMPTNVPAFTHRLLTEEESPYLRTVIQNFGSFSDRQYSTVMPGTNGFQDWGIAERGLNNSLIFEGTNAARILGSWARMH